MFTSLKGCIAGLGLMLILAAPALAAPVTWYFVDTYQNDWPVVVKCPSGATKNISSAQSVQCAIPAGGKVTFSSGGKLACTANFDKKSRYLPATSTCKPAAYSSKTLVFPGSQGVYPSVLWTFIDAYNADWPVAVACPNGATRKISSSGPVNCPVPANGQVTFSTGGKLACTAKFDANSKYQPASSTCKPAATAGNTLVFPQNQGVNTAPMLNALTIGFAGNGATVTCASTPSSSCGTVTNQLVTLNGPLNQNGAMTLSFSVGTTQCNVAFYNNFIDDRQTTCQNVSLMSMSGPGPAYMLTFPSKGSGSSSVGELVVYPVPPSSASTGTLVGNRTLTFVNQCSQPVWFGLVSGTVGPQAGDGEHGNAKVSGNLCAGDPSGNNVTCPYGSSCRYVDATQAYCFYNPADPAMPTSGNPLHQYMLAALSKSGPVSRSVTIPIYQENAVVFSGGASARLGCQDAAGNFVQCAVGNCNEDKNALGCGYTNGTGNGATIAEFTLQAQGIDYYDLSIINGAHVPMSMEPTKGQTYDSKQQGSTVGYYWCGAPGSTNKTAASHQPACAWNLGGYLVGGTAIPPSKTKYFVNVTAPAVTPPIDVSKLNYCSKDTDCTGNQSCGLSLDLLTQISEDSRATLFSAMGANGKSGPYTCGKKLGYSTPVDICSLVTSGDDGFLHCNNPLTQKSPAGGSVSMNFANLYACNGPTDNCVKAKSDYSGKVCCGCTTWGLTSGMSDACTYKGSGVNSNHAWSGALKSSGGKGKKKPEPPDVKGKIKFLKQACPTAYAYQFDDATSTFNCYVDGTGSAVGYNTTNYTITFCPGGTVLQ